MADLEHWKKYPAEGKEGEDSYRLDHPNFQNVQRVTYAKGVITDFKKYHEQSSDVTSMVKVDIEGYGESDYIPLFYHPKPQYWDYSIYKATDFDEEQKCFTRAYWSFRCDDEVVVLMQASSPGATPEPVAVMGFWDNYPRIGEHIVKITGAEVKDGADYFIVEGRDYAHGDKGPDGLDLQLVTEAEKRHVYSDTIQYFYQIYRTQIGGRWYVSCFFEWWGSGWMCTFHTINSYIHIYMWTYQSATYHRNVNDYIFCVGPYLYVLRTVSKWQSTFVYHWMGEEGPWTEENWAPGICALMPEWEADNQAQCVWEYPAEPWEDNYTDTEYTPVFLTRLIRALYNKENYDAAKNWEYSPTGYSEPTDIPPGFISDSFLSGFLDNPGKNKDPQFKVYVRPHTKEELIEAGLYDGSP